MGNYKVKISWDYPSDNGGLSIIGYQIKIEGEDGDFSQDLTECDAENDQEIIDSRQCTVLCSTLFDSPFNLPK